MHSVSEACKDKLTAYVIKITVKTGMEIARRISVCNVLVRLFSVMLPVDIRYVYENLSKTAF